MDRPPGATASVASGAAPTVVCTLGMHRSGTSLVSRVLNLLGVCLGPSDHIKDMGVDNPRGYWEHHPIVDLNDEILVRWGGSWDRPPAFPRGWPNDERLADLRQRARAIVAGDFHGVPLWGWKDPRTSLTLPFWQELIHPMRFVICVRNPLAVAASLARRNGMRPGTADALWLTYLRASLAHTAGQPRVVVFYEDFLGHWLPGLQRLAAFIGRPERAADPDVRHTVADFVDEALCHARPSLDDLAADAGASLATKTLFVALKDDALRDTDPAAPGVAGAAEEGAQGRQPPRREAAVHRGRRLQRVLVPVLRRGSREQPVRLLSRPDFRSGRWSSSEPFDERPQSTSVIVASQP